jgi:hypothetical protein
MSAVVLAVVVSWLVLSALATVAFAVVARGGLREDRWRDQRDGGPAGSTDAQRVADRRSRSGVG